MDQHDLSVKPAWYLRGPRGCVVCQRGRAWSACVVWLRGCVVAWLRGKSAWSTAWSRANFAHNEVTFVSVFYRQLG